MCKNEAAIRTIREYVLKDKVKAKRTELARAYMKMGKTMIIKHNYAGIERIAQQRSSSSLDRHGSLWTSFTSRSYSSFAQKRCRKLLSMFSVGSPLVNGRALPFSGGATRNI